MLCHLGVNMNEFQIILINCLNFLKQVNLVIYFTVIRIKVYILIDCYIQREEIILQIQIIFFYQNVYW